MLCAFVGKVGFFKSLKAPKETNMCLSCKFVSQIEDDLDK